MEQAYMAAASSLIRRRVKNRQGESLGRIEELVIDLEQGFIAYAVLGFAEWVGQSGKRFVVPWGSLRMDPADRCFVLDVRRETLSSAEGMSAAEA